MNRASLARIAALCASLHLGCAAGEGDEDRTPESPTTPVPSPSAFPSPTSTVLDYCPTTIDVFGYSNVVFSGCGGTSVTNLAAGLFSPGAAGYDNTLAGRLQAKVMADPDLAAKFGTTWKIRSCAKGGATLSTFVATTPAGECTGPDAPSAGANVEMCTSSPAPLILFSANDVFDRCHGGGSDTARPDEEAVFADHWSQRLGGFLALHDPKVALVSSQHEWHGQQGGNLTVPGACTWSRADWNRAGATRWISDNPTYANSNVMMVGDMHDSFKSHHSCCGQLGVPCETDWFAQGTGGDGWVHFGCEGASALTEFWFAQLKQILMNSQYTCP